MSNSLGQRTIYLDALDLITQLTDPLKGLTQFTYDNIGNLTQIKDGKNRVTLFGYDTRNWSTSRQDALLRTETASSDGIRNLTTMTDRKGNWRQTCQ